MVAPAKCWREALWRVKSPDERAEESHSTGAIFGWIVGLAPVLYVALYFPLLSLAARAGDDWVRYFARLYSPMEYVADHLQKEIITVWTRMDPEGSRLLARQRD